MELQQYFTTRSPSTSLGTRGSLMLIASLALSGACGAQTALNDNVDISELLGRASEYGGKMIRVCGCIESPKPEFGWMLECTDRDLSPDLLETAAIDVVGSSEEMLNLHNATYACIYAEFKLHRPGTIILGNLVSTVGILSILEILESKQPEVAYQSTWAGQYPRVPDLVTDH